MGGLRARIRRLTSRGGAALTLSVRGESQSRISLGTNRNLLSIGVNGPLADDGVSVPLPFVTTILPPSHVDKHFSRQSATTNIITG